MKCRVISPSCYKYDYCSVIIYFDTFIKDLFVSIHIVIKNKDISKLIYYLYCQEDLDTRYNAEQFIRCYSHMKEKIE